MLLKRAYFAGERDGEPLLHIVRPGEQVKTASHMLPSVQSFIDQLTPDPRYTYVLVNAMGYSEFYGANSNRDWYGYNPHLDFNGLLHAPPDFGQNYEIDKMQGQNWPYGFPSYYGATVYAHHKNTDPQQFGFGDVIFVAANPVMKRIELVERVFNEEAQKKGHTSILERIAAGERVDVSMGCKVPFDFCLHPTTLVRTIDGWREARTVEIGERLLTHRGRYRSVTRTYVRQVEDGLVELDVVGLPSIKVTANHPMYVVRGAALRTCCDSVNGERRRCSPGQDGVCSFCSKQVKIDPEWIDAGEVRSGDYLVAPAGEEGHVSIELPKARLLGYWIGDGYRVRQRTSKKKDDDYRLMGVGFTVAHHEEAHLQRLLYSINEAGWSNDPIIYEYEAGQKAYHIITYDQQLADWLLRHGAYEAGEAYTKRLSEVVFSWKKEALLHLLGGWIDTNGHFDPVKGLVRIATSVRSLALDAQRLLRILGVPAPITTSMTSAGEVYQVSIQPDHVCRLKLWDYAEKVARFERDRRGGSSILLTSGYVLHPVRGIKHVEYSGEVINFSVDEDESYVAEGVATHNCSICTDWPEVKRAWKTFDPKQHRHPGVAILAYHKTRRPIRGLAVTRKDYCEHMINLPGQILPDGRKVFVYNDFPRFFDISFVLVGADRTARVMWHLGSTKPMEGTSMRPFKDHSRYELARLLENLLNKTSAINIASIEKEIPDGFVQAIHHDADTAPDFSDTFAMIVAKANDKKLLAKKILTALAVLGIVPSPREFQTLALTHVPGGDIIKRALDEKGVVFDTSIGGLDDTFSVNEKLYDAKLTQALTPLMEERSSFDPFLTSRLTSLEPKVASVLPIPMRTDLLDKVAAQYNGYRISVLENANNLFPKVTSFLGGSALLEGIGKGIGLAALLLGLGPVISLLSSHLRSRREEGQQIGTMASLVADNPSFVTITTIGAGLRAAMALNKAGGLVQAARSVITAARGAL